MVKPEIPVVITIGIDPEVHLGPVVPAWHGITIAGWCVLRSRAA
jgi:hypothetical protein